MRLFLLKITVQLRRFSIWFPAELFEKRVSTLDKDVLKQRALYYHEYPVPGKLEVQITKPTNSQDDLSLAYTPGVAEPVLAIAENPDDVFR